MKSKRIVRNTFILIIWTFLFFLWFCWFLSKNWDFYLFSADSWKYLHDEWMGDWTIKGTEWIFIISLILVIPVWIATSYFFISRNYSRLFFFKKKTVNIKKTNTKIHVQRKKSYKEVRPKPFTAVGDTMLQSLSEPSPFGLESDSRDDLSTSSMHFSHRELPTSEDDVSYSGKDSFERIPLPEDNFEPVDENIPQLISDSGASLLEKVTLGENSADLVALTEQTAYLISLDKQVGDWLADEERFNDEDPLWFSESAHRVSPVLRLKEMETAFQKILKEQGIKLQTKLILVKTDGNIINAEDMLDIWKEMNVMVVRSGNGRPEELPLFGEIFPKALPALDDESIEKIKNAL